MTIPIELCRLVLQEKKRSNFSGKILQLGKQDVFLDVKLMADIANQVGVSLSQVPVELTINQWDGKESISDKTFFSQLGFSQVDSLDFSQFEDATLVWDLNNPLPETHFGQYDVVYNGGTMEHVFHLPHVLENIYKLLKVGGRVIHISPSSNYVDHGFYMLSPTLFYDYYAANHFTIGRCCLFEHTPSHDVPWNIFEYSPGSLDHLSVGGFDRGTLLGTFFVAQKEENSTFDQIPMQGFYRKRWPETKVPEIKMKETPSNPIPQKKSFPLAQKIKRFLKSFGS